MNPWVKKEKEEASSYSERFMSKREDVNEQGPSLPLGEGPSSGSYEERFFKKAGLPHIPEETRKTSDLPRLSKKFEKQLEADFKELLNVEGNILSLKKDTKTIYVSSCFSSEGKTVSSIHTAYALAVYAGKKVLLIDGNPHAPQIHKFFKIPESAGLRDFLYSGFGFKAVIQDTKYQNLTIMTIGRPTSQKHISGSIIKTKLDEIRDQFDYIIFDGSSVLKSSEAANVVACFDMVILVVTCEKTKWEVVQMAAEKLHSGGVTVLAIVLNRRRYYIPEMIYRRI
ncbi:MAG: hypothetical protein B5M53_09535 [Candidatus Cloacimonas sp. 4484_209]|nr:MAG: hypothetical protein B5M53_09535 [Candidatus Cloacimonas sp. 4484_209]